MEIPPATSVRSRKIVLIDDDPSFCNIMQSFALMRELDLDSFESLEDMGSIGRLSQYDLAIVDYDLGVMNGVEIAEYLPVFFDKMPMILVSGKTRENEPISLWPDCIKRFVHKDEGPDKILDAAVSCLRSQGRKNSSFSRSVAI